MDASLKQRLVGAVVLVALAVIFLPMLVKGPAPDSGVSNVSLSIPREPKGDAATVTQDLPLVAPAPAAGVSGMPAPVAAPAAPVAGLPVEAAPSTPTPIAAVAAGDFAVSFGSYASAGDADKVIAALQAKGLPGFREAVTVNGKPAQRVAIGPFANRATAESARLRSAEVRSDISAKVIVLNAAPSATPAALPTQTKATDIAVAAKVETPAAPKLVVKPDAKSDTKSEVKPEAKPQPKPADVAATEPPPKKPASAASTGFVVQVGAFGSSVDATAQRDALRKAGFNAFTDTVPGANGPLTRVRVGPVINRAEAETLKVKLQQAGKDGMVRPHP